MTRRTVPLVVQTMPTPAILDGKPTVPAYWAKLSSTATLLEGPNHIHAIRDPNPVWNPRTSGWSTPPPTPTKPFKGRWTVGDLPDPPDGGYYWLGDASSADGTSGITARARQWAAHASTPKAPAWHSFFPFKPSVRAFDSYLPSGEIVHHPKGVHFNSQYVEHMWCDFGRPHRQPFTWIIAAMIAGYPSGEYRHHILDAGHNPDGVHFPRLSAQDCNTPRTIADGLAYRTSLTVTNDRFALTARTGTTGNATVRARGDGGLRPKMFFGIFNGTNSHVGAYDTGSRRTRRGTTDNTVDQRHRFYVLGRRQNFISQLQASHILVFEMRFWDEALTTDDLDEHYDQLSATYQFDRYRSLR